MKFGPVPIAEAVGKILGHNIAGPDGRRLLRKGRALGPKDIEVLANLRRGSVYVAELEEGDIGEDDAAKRIAAAAVGRGLRLSGAATGRVNATATALGLFRVDIPKLRNLNAVEGTTLACLEPDSVVRPGQMAATIKVIPYAVPDGQVARAEALGAILRVDELPMRRVALVMTGSVGGRSRLVESFAPLEERIVSLGSELTQRSFVDLDDESGEESLVAAIRGVLGSDLVVLAGDTAIMDRHDIAPRAVERAGGRIEAFGAPVDPGNLLMLAYIDDVPVVGAPGCARSRKTNVVDWVLPRLLAGDRLGRDDIVEFGAGGLLEDVPERPLPRSRIRG
ncbi:MAG TPA: molybdopterin-binding protein [Vicinamibacteria bacterium]|nr:molybdopterin-binding protein [Vicinamibacteria bacterium]